MAGAASATAPPWGAASSEPSSTLCTELSVLSSFFSFILSFSSSAGAAAFCNAQSPLALLHIFAWEVASTVILDNGSAAARGMCQGDGYTHGFIVCRCWNGQKGGSHTPTVDCRSLLAGTVVVAAVLMLPVS